MLFNFLLSQHETYARFPQLCPVSVCSSPRERAREKNRVVWARFPEKRLVIELIYIFIYTRCPLGTRLISNGSENSSFIGNTPNKTYTFSIQCYVKKKKTSPLLRFLLVWKSQNRTRLKSSSAQAPSSPAISIRIRQAPANISLIESRRQVVSKDDCKT